MPSLLQGEFLHNMLQEPRTIVNALAINEDNVMVTGGDNGALWCAASVCLSCSGAGSSNPFVTSTTPREEQRLSVKAAHL